MNVDLKNQNIKKLADFNFKIFHKILHWEKTYFSGKFPAPINADSVVNLQKPTIIYL